jgi:hypothetical protein
MYNYLCITLFPCIAHYLCTTPFPCTSLICLIYKGTLLYCITYFNIQRITHNSNTNNFRLSNAFFHIFVIGKIEYRLCYNTKYYLLRNNIFVSFLLETGNTIQVIQKQAEKDTSTQKTNSTWQTSK